MIYHRYWTIIIFVINVAIILMDRRNSGVLPFLLKGTRLKGFIITFGNDIEYMGLILSIKRGPCPIYQFLDLLGRDPRYVLIYSSDIFLKQKLWILFGPFQKQFSSKFWVHIVANIGKMVIEIIRRNVTSNMLLFIFTRYELFDFRIHFGVISAECVNIIEIDIIHTRYFIP